MAGHGRSPEIFAAEPSQSHGKDNADCVNKTHEHASLAAAFEASGFSYNKLHGKNARLETQEVCRATAADCTLCIAAIQPQGAEAPATQTHRTWGCVSNEQPHRHLEVWLSS
eukprot:325864-Chlamydomonas_euryale.AAC.2